MEIRAQRRKKSVLVEGAVKPWHIVFLALVSWMVGLVGGGLAARQLDPGIRNEFRSIAMSAIAAAIVLAFVVVVPELRRSLPFLFGRPSPKPCRHELVLAFAAMLAWGYGLYRIGVCFPILSFHPQAYQTLGFGAALAPFELKYLLFFFAAIIVAPVGEELVFRGYLLNLWMARHGVWPAVIFSTLLFGVLHWERTLFAIPLGFILACVYLRYDSLWPGIFLHAAYNLLAFPWLLGRFFYVKRWDSIDQISNWIPEIVITVLLIPLFASFWRRFRPAPSA
jgi:membrane protease YdiL (CAAX protease family)